MSAPLGLQMRGVLTMANHHGMNQQAHQIGQRLLQALRRTQGEASQVHTAYDATALVPLEDALQGGRSARGKPTGPDAPPLERLESGLQRLLAQISRSPRPKDLETLVGLLQQVGSADPYLARRKLKEIQAQHPALVASLTAAVRGEEELDPPPAPGLKRPPARPSFSRGPAVTEYT